MHLVIPVLLVLLASAATSTLILNQTTPVFLLVSPPSHVVVLVMENQGINQTYNCGLNCSYITSLAGQYGLARNYSSVAHRSLADYLTFLNGSNFAYPGSPFAGSSAPGTGNCSPAACRVNGTNILDEITASGRTWRAYLEDYVGGCHFSDTSGARSVEYDDNHNPFVYMAEAHTSPAYCANLVNANPTGTGYLALPTRLLSDLNNVTSRAPNFLWLTPNNCDDGHDVNGTITSYNKAPSICPLSNSVVEQNNYLQALVPRILNSTTFTTSPSLLYVTWDEGVVCDASTDPAYPETFPVCIDRVTTILAGSDAQPSHVSNRGYSHYGFLPTLEEVWGLAPLAGQVSGPTFDEFLVTFQFAGGGGRRPLAV